jgi:hypothetical protein
MDLGLSKGIFRHTTVLPGARRGASFARGKRLRAFTLTSVCRSFAIRQATHQRLAKCEHKATESLIYEELTVGILDFIGP